MFSIVMVCLKPVLSHSYYLICSSCESCTHLKCLPNVDKAGAFIVCQSTDKPVDLYQM